MSALYVVLFLAATVVVASIINRHLERGGHFDQFKED